MNVLRSYLLVLFVMAASGSSRDDSDTDAKMICEATPTTPSFHSLESTPKSRRRQPKSLLTNSCVPQRLFTPSVAVTSHKKSTNLPKWTDAELQYLTLFLLLHTDGKSWTLRKDANFWDKAGEFIQQLVRSPYYRSGNMCLCVCIT